MNIETALKKGYVRTGIYARNGEEIQARMSELRSDGYKVLFVTVPDNPHSRGGVGVGYAIVAEPRYLKDQQAQASRKELFRHPLDVQVLRDNFEKELAVLEERAAGHRTWLVANGYEA